MDFTPDYSDVLGMYVVQNESAKFWLSILNGLKNRGVEDILIACVDGLTGFPQAIEAVFPQTEIQQCIIHQIRNTTKFVSYKEIKPLMADLKRVYVAPTEEVVLAELDSFDENGAGNTLRLQSHVKITGCIFVTFPVSKLLTSRVVRLLQLLNMEPILVTFPVM